LRGFFERVKARRGWQIATVAVARKLLVICWHLIRDQVDYAFARPSLIAKKTRALELRAGAPAHRGRPARPAAAYSLKTVRDRERAVLAQAETAYHHLVTGWQPQRPVGKALPASPKRARHPSMPTDTAQAIKASPAGGYAGLDRPPTPAARRKTEAMRLNA
jgi:hypothetical protein